MLGREWVRVDAGAKLSALDYPGKRMPTSGLLDGDRFWPGKRLASIDGRRLVLAVGSNADPAVLAGKLRWAGAGGPVPMVLARAVGLAIGHSAHVSEGGYLPAAPYASAVTTPVVGLWLTTAQLAGVDATEPNYRRVRLPASQWRLAIDAGEAPDGYEVYASRWGVLAPDGGRPLALGRQVALHHRLAGLADLAERAPWSDSAAVVAALRKPEQQSRVLQALADAGWVADAGIPGGA
ncbi:MAG TPA: hypothetical protein VEX15_17440 [Nocardioidaceae bacterium]|nr:hypothetical protein [Nocardioidaceae bacterium]